MWVYLPSSCVPASECSEKASGPHSTISASDTEPFATWNGKPLLPPKLPRLWKQEPCLRRLSGLTLSPSEANVGAERWIASLPGSHARTSVSPTRSARGSTASAAACSSTSSTSRTIAVRGSSLWRTSQPSLLPPPPLWTKRKENSSKEQPPASWENWPTVGGMRNGCIYPRPMWEPATGGSDGSASLGVGTWMTPNVPNGGRSVSAELVASKGMTADGEKKTVGLESQTRHWAGGINWPTPDANVMNDGEDPQTWLDRAARLKAKHGNGNGAGMPLAVAGAMWSTPDVCSGARDMSKIDPQAQKRANTKRTIGLPTEAANWPPPTARDHKGGGDAVTRPDGKSRMDMLDWRAEAFSRPVQSIHDGRELSPTTRTLRPRLNPAFACWLMGWPIWWTNPAITSSARSAMVSYRSKLQSALSSLLGGQESSDEWRKAA